MAEDANHSSCQYNHNACTTRILLNSDLQGTNKTITYEELLVRLGGFGRYQIRVFILVSLFEIPAAWAMLLPVLIHADPKWGCLSGNLSNASVNWNDSRFFHNSSEITSLNNFTISCTDACDQAVYFLEPFTTIVTEWCLYGSKKVIPGVITSIQMSGVLIGALVTGQLADLYGRRKTLFIAYIFLLICWLVSAFSVSWPMYAALRFLIGAQIGGVLVVNFVLPMEFVLPPHRTFCGCVGFWAIGFMLLGLWGYLIHEWRTLIIATSVAGIPLLATWKWIPESPRWLYYNGHIRRAQAILNEIAVTNRRPLPDISHLSHFFELEKIEASKMKSRFTYLHIFSSMRLGLTSLILMYLWLVSSCVYYGMSLNAKNLSGNRYLNIFLSGLVEIPALIYLLIVNNRFGRRKTLFSLMMTASIFCFAILILSALGYLTKLKSLTLAFSLVGKSAISGAWAAVQILSAECFPTVIRNIGIASCSMAARIGGIVAPQLVSLAKISISITFTVFGVLVLVAAILGCLLPEKTNVPLPDVLADVSTQHHLKFSDSGLTPLKSRADLEMEEIPLDVKVIRQ